VVVAGEQTRGRGRAARRWESPKGSGLYFSVLFRPELPPATAHLVNVAAALSVAEAARSLLNLELGLKWPNDLLLSEAGERKVCGILSESATRNGALDYCVTGIGINLREPPCLPPDVAERSGWLLQAEGPFGQETPDQGTPGREETYWTELLPNIVEIFFGWIDAMEREGAAPMLAIYREKCASVGRTVRVETDAETLIGTCADIGDDGELILETPLGTRRFHVADVTHAKLA
jgi:BirA family biotin operon repressor/biotin-[acetyl-CoA-carboxylase] ligase